MRYENWSSSVNRFDQSTPLRVLDFWAQNASTLSSLESSVFVSTCDVNYNNRIEEDEEDEEDEEMRNKRGRRKVEHDEQQRGREWSEVEEKEEEEEKDNDKVYRGKARIKWSIGIRLNMMRRRQVRL